MKNQKSKIIIKFEPSLAFDEEFLEFVEEVLSWSLKSKENKNKEQGRELRTINNPPIQNITLFKNKMIIKQARNNRSFV
jgi:hypothetical protein